LLKTEFIIALLIAPIFSYFYAKEYATVSTNIFWLFSDFKSLFLLIGLYPILEEITFRGVIQGWFLRYQIFKKSYFGLTIANIVTSLLFSLIHIVNHKLVWAMLIFFPSLVFGYFRDRSKDIKLSIILHIFYNFSFLSIVGH